jgi:hypothetical protein
MPNNTGYFKAGISVYGNKDAYNPNNDDAEDEDDEDLSDPPDEPNPVATFTKLLGKVLNRLNDYEPMMQSAQDAPEEEVDATPKRFQDYLQEYLVTDSTWKAPKREKVSMAMKVIQQDLPEDLIADTTNQHVSPLYENLC